MVALLTPEACAMASMLVASMPRSAKRSSAARRTLSWASELRDLAILHLHTFDVEVPEPQRRLQRVAPFRHLSLTPILVHVLLTSHSSIYISSSYPEHSLCNAAGGDPASSHSAHQDNGSLER